MASSNLTLTTKAREGGVFGVTVSFKDTDSTTAVTPDSASWSLYSKTDQIVNSRTDVSIAAPSTSNTIVLSGNDLRLTDTDKRKLVVTYQYDSATLGNNVVDVVQISFDVEAVAGE